jgi:hypothetical protein
MIPAPPVDLPLNAGGQTVLTVLTSVVAVGNLAFTAMLCRRYRTSTPALITLSGFARLEPLVSGPGRISLVAVVPAAFAMLSFGSSFPALVTMSRPDPPAPLLWGAAVASVALALAILHLSLFAVPGEPDIENEVANGTDRSRGDRHRWSLGAR